MLSEVVDPEENLFKESLADLDAKQFFPEVLPNYFQNTTNKYFSILNLNIRSLQASFNLSNYQMINLHQQTTGGGVCIFIHYSINFKERRHFSISKNDSEILSRNY